MERAESGSDKPLLVYDGTCGFCKRWIARWERIIGDRAAYAPSQDVGSRFPGIPASSFAEAVYLIEPGGRTSRGAEAIFRALALVPGRGRWLWVYRNVPGFKAVSETGYRLVAGHRPFFTRVTDWLWGAARDSAGRGGHCQAQGEAGRGARGASAMVTSGRHVVVCGAGIVGLASAYYLLERGHRVTVLERGAPDHDSCSLGNAGFISPSHFVPLAAPGIVRKALAWMGDPESPFYVHPRFDPELIAWGIRFWRSSTRERARKAAPLLRDLNLASRALYEDLAARTGNSFGLTREGLLLLLRTERAFEEERALAARSRELGMPADVLDAKGVAALEPDMAFDILGGVLYPLDAHLVPQRLVATMTQLVTERGGAFVWEAEVTGWKATQSTVKAALTTRGEMGGDEFVLTAGSWTPILARGLGVRISMQPGKGYSLTMDAPRQLPRRSLILQEARVAVTPMGSSLRVGGTMELAGYDLRINPPRIRGMTRSVSRYLPAYRPEDFDSIRPWCGLRPCTPDGLPYIGRLRGRQNVIVASGHAMMGVSMGAITGKLVSEIVSGESPSVDLSGLSTERFG